MTIIQGCIRRDSELSNKAQSRASNIGYDARNYSRVKTWIVVLLRVWMTFSPFYLFIYLVYLIRCLFLSLFYLFIFASFILSFPSLSLLIFSLLFFILFLVLTEKSYRIFLLYVSPYILSDSWYA